MKILVLPAILAVAAAALASSLQPADAIVSALPTAAHGPYSDYQHSLLIAFFTLVCSVPLVTMVMHYYRMQWGRRSVLTRYNSNKDRSKRLDQSING
jgi:hypothetical protein